MSQNRPHINHQRGYLSTILTCRVVDGLCQLRISATIAGESEHNTDSCQRRSNAEQVPKTHIGGKRFEPFLDTAITTCISSCILASDHAPFDSTITMSDDCSSSSNRKAQEKEDVRLTHSVNNYMESNNTVISKPRHVFFFYSVVIVVRFYPTPPHYSTSHSEVMAMQCAPTGIALRAICSWILETHAFSRKLSNIISATSQRFSCRCAKRYLSTLATRPQDQRSHEMLKELPLKTLGNRFARGGPWPLSDLYKHLRNRHLLSEEEIHEVQAAVKKAIYGPGKKCNVCERIYFSERGLRRHIQRDHGGTLTTNEPHAAPNLTCFCKMKLCSQEDFAYHCQEAHEGPQFVIINETFAPFAAFEEWLESKEIETHSKLVRRNIRKSSKGHTYVYKCHHSGGNNSENNPEEEKRRYRQRKRVVKDCPCFVKAQLNGGGGVETVAFFGHYGHEVNVASLPIRQEDELVVKQMIEAGVPAHTIVTKLRRKYWKEIEDPQKQSRLCYLTTRDVANIAERHGSIAGRSNVCDRVSVRNLLQDNEDVAAVNLTETTELSGDGFLLAFITRLGKVYLEEFGRRGIILDDTFNVSRYAFRLATLVVSDDAGNGYPCGHLISFRMSSNEVAVLFNLVKKCIPDFDTKYVMTDDTSVFFNAYTICFPNSTAQKVLCAFHMTQIFQRKHRELLTELEAYSAQDSFCDLLFEVNPSIFENKFATYLSWLESIQANEMIEAESWHNKLKHVLLHSKQNNRLDTVVYTLIEYAHDRHLQLKAKSVRGASDLSWRRKQNVRMHKIALSFYKGKDAVIQESPDRYAVRGPREGIFHTVMIEDSCSCSKDMNSHCERCGCCSYRIHCDCSHTHSGVTCVHGHAVMTFGVRAVQRHNLACDTESAAETTSRTPLSSIENSFDTSQAHPDTSYTLPATIIERDRIREALHEAEGLQNQIGEMIKSYAKNERLDLLQEISEVMRNGIRQLPLETLENRFARRQEMQTTGAGPTPVRIQSYKSRFQLKLEKKKQEKH
ncbi:unnamed protein product [Cylicocyclus nassatus]|uniref:C2H2-type domain-containing protein n=1 Tax=Cylicocyclus nassatus TaxID=53992 RepID=A0AA36H3B8_CYLNA|nr:unnamed protein product [Cylicocyclus nassatus]